MPTSITSACGVSGTATVERGVSSATRTYGFTLIELLVVVLLIAITASLAVVALTPDDRTALRDEATRLAVSFQQAQDEAVLTGRSIAWQGDAESYQYLRRGPERSWVPIDAETAFAARRLTVPVRLVDVEVAGSKIAPGTLVVMSPASGPPNVRFLLEANKDRAAVEVGSITRVVPYNGS